MPTAVSFPGVYIEEIPSGVRTIAGVATSITAFVGFTVRGPVNQAERILSFGDFERTFGGLHRDSEVGYAVQQFFLNGGTDAYVVRVAQGFATAEVTLRDAANSAVLKVSAASPGAWGNNLRLDLDYDTGNPDSTFNLLVTRYENQDGNLVAVENEQHRNLSMNSVSATYAVNVVNHASKLLRLERPAGLSLTDKGFSLSGKLNPFPALTANDTALNLVLDGTQILALNLVIPPVPADLTALVAAFTAAIAAVGLAGKVTAERTDALGQPAAGGDYLKLTSQTVTERSAVQVLPAATKDASTKLKLGLLKGGREKEGASTRRPIPTGTLSADLAAVLGNNITGNLQITVNDNSSGAAVAVFPTATRALAATTIGPGLRDQIRDLLRGLGQEATADATVQLTGSLLRIVPSAATPNASIVFGGPAGTDARLTGAGAFVNVQQYSLGGGANFGAQTGAVAGADGFPPNAAGIIGDDDAKSGLYALRDVDLFNLLAIPRTTTLSASEAASVLAAAESFCMERRAFLLVDPDPTKGLSDLRDYISGLGLQGRNAALFFPQIKFADPLDGFRARSMAASGALAGIFARTDSERGVWKAPAGTEAVIRGAQGLAVALTDRENGTLNPLGVNCLRSFPVYGHVVWGGRTLQGADRMASEWKYIPVRRLALYIEESLYRGTQWVVFEPNDEPLWAQIRLNVGAFMNNLFRQGAFQGQTPREAYFVKCDKETTTQNDINLGVVNIVVGFAPLKPAEFVIIKLQQMAGQIAT